MKYKLSMDRYSDCKRVSSLGLVIPISNSEIGTATCKRLWSYNYMQCFKKETSSQVLSYGIIWHSLLEKVLLEYKKENKLSTEKFYKIIVENLDKELNAEGIYFRDEPEKEKQELKSRILISMEGWRKNWEQNISRRFDVVGVELSVSRPCEFQGASVSCEVALVKDKDDKGCFLRPCYMGEAINKELLEPTPFNIQDAKIGSIFDAVLPYYKVGKIDCVLREKGTKNLYILDHKTTSRPSMYERNLQFDYQMQTYAAMLQYEIEQGLHKELEGCQVIGGIWDLCHSKIPLQVDVIKKGTALSKAKSKSIPSYVFRNAIAQNGFDEEDYKDHLLYIEQTVDQKYFVILETYYTQKDFERCYSEDFIKAHDLANMRLALSAISDNDDDYLSFCAVAPRNNTICTQWGNCTYSQNCVANRPLMLYNNTRCTKLKWYI